MYECKDVFWHACTYCRLLHTHTCQPCPYKLYTRLLSPNSSAQTHFLWSEEKTSETIGSQLQENFLRRQRGHAKSVTTGSRTEMKWEGRRLAIMQHGKSNGNVDRIQKNQNRNWVCYKGKNSQPYSEYVHVWLNLLENPGLLFLWWI